MYFDPKSAQVKVKKSINYVWRTPMIDWIAHGFIHKLIFKLILHYSTHKRLVFCMVNFIYTKGACIRLLIFDVQIAGWLRYLIDNYSKLLKAVSV